MEFIFSFLIVIIGLIVGLYFIFITFLKLIKRQKWIHIAALAIPFPFVLLLSIVFPWIFVPVLYLFGIIISIVKYKSWGLARIWERIFAISFVAALNGLLFLIGIGIIGSCSERQGRARQSEAKSNLAGIATMEISYFAEHGAWSDRFDVIGWSPFEIGIQKYSFYLSDKIDTDKKVIRKYRAEKYRLVDLDFTIRIEKPEVEALELKAVKIIKEKYGLGADSNGFTAVAIGNIDSDPTADVWIIGREKEFINVINDINNDDVEGFNIYNPDDTINIDSGTICICALIINGILWLLSFIYLKRIKQSEYKQSP